MSIRRSFRRAGSTIHYWTSGGSQAVAVVLAHGVTLDHNAFAKQVPALVEAGYQVISWDMRGHGISQPMGQGFSIRRVAQDLAEMLKETGVSEAVLVGQSFGGSVVQEFYRRQPRRVRGLVLIGAMALGEPMPWHHRLLVRMRPYLLRMWPESHLRRVTPSFLSERAEVREYIAHTISALSKADLVAVTEAALEGMLHYPPLHDINVPVLLVQGAEETPMFARMMRTWSERAPTVHLEVIAEAGHLANQENPNAFNELLLGFLLEDRGKM
jgi:3-oxoadipate enol-lactonase